MKPAPFKYAEPATIAETVAVLGEYGFGAKVIAGGQSLVPLMNMRLSQPEVLVDLNSVSELNYIRPYDGGVAIGATARQRELEENPLIAERAPAIRSVAEWIGHPQIRNRGTIGGSIAHADPAAELPAAALAFDAELTVVGPQGTRTLAPDDLFLGYLETTLEPDEILTEVRFPDTPANAGWSIKEVARRHGDFAVAGVIALVRLADDQISDARLVCFGVGGRPVRLGDVEQSLVGEAPSDELFAAARARVSESVEGDDDLHASADYRRSVAGALAQRALHEAVERARMRRG